MFAYEITWQAFGGACKEIQSSIFLWGSPSAEGLIEAFMTYFYGSVEDARTMQTFICNVKNLGLVTDLCRE